MDNNTPLTISVPAAGRKYFGWGPDASYRAAKRGLIPTVRMGQRLFVPVAAMERKMEEANPPCSAEMAGDISAADLDQKP